LTTIFLNTNQNLLLAYKMWPQNVDNANSKYSLSIRKQILLL